MTQNIFLTHEGCFTSGHQPSIDKAAVNAYETYPSTTISHIEAKRSNKTKRHDYNSTLTGAS